ncbi:hypothetical protein JMUB7526_28480 [Staphylococcus aureus]
MQYNTTRSITENQDNKTLKDMTKSGKQRPWREKKIDNVSYAAVSYTHLRAHETCADLVCRLLLEKKKVV